MSETITKSRSDLTGRKCRAVFSPCERFRYVLDWITDPGKPHLTALMLNPSTADHEQTDPTVDGMLKRAHHWGYGGLRVINLFAFRATDPAEMMRESDPVGPWNDRAIMDALRAAVDDGSPVICGWCRHGSHRGRAATVLAMASRTDALLMCLARNYDGSPRHPLYIAHDVKPERL